MPPKRKRRTSRVDYNLLNNVGKKSRFSPSHESSSSSESESSDSESSDNNLGHKKGFQTPSPKRKVFTRKESTQAATSSADSSESETDTSWSKSFGKKSYPYSVDSDSSDSLPDPFEELPKFRHSFHHNSQRINSDFDSESCAPEGKKGAKAYTFKFKASGTVKPKQQSESKTKETKTHEKKKSVKTDNLKEKSNPQNDSKKTTYSVTPPANAAAASFPPVPKKMADPASPSEMYRQQGNQIYVTAKSNLCPAIRKERIRQATNFYHKAFNFSKTEDEKVSAAKNLAMAAFRMAEVEEKVLERLSLLIHWYKEAFKFFSLSFRDSKDIKEETWRDGVLASTRGCWELMKTGRIDQMNVEDRKPVYYDIIQVVHVPCVKADMFINLAFQHFHSGIDALQQKDHKKAIYELKECHFPINEAQRFGDGVLAVEGEVRVLNEDVFMHFCMAESVQARETGDSIFRKVLLDEENINMDMVYEMIDWYKQAILRTREVTEVELEAVALSRMGRVYDKILKLKYKAKEYLMRSIQLAHSMHPRVFHGEDWFMECSEILERYQKETVAAEEEKWQKEREGLMKELTKEMGDINKNDEKSGEEFLKFVYRVFPPKNPEHKLVGIPRKKGASVEHSVLKKTLQKAIVHYHPDRVDSEKHGKTWKVIAEEITKCLTRRYERMK